MRRHKIRGSTIIVWSAGGAAWAKKAVEALGIEELVDIIMCKPRWYVDDLPADEWMKRNYLEDIVKKV